MKYVKYIEGLNSYLVPTISDYDEVMDELLSELSKAKTPVEKEFALELIKHHEKEIICLMKVNEKQPYIHELHSNLV